MTNPPILPEEITLKRIAELTRDPSQGDDFCVRINWRDKPFNPPVIFANLEGVREKMLAQPEGWISQLSGGSKGIFNITVAHANDPSTPLGPPLRCIFSQGRDEFFFNWEALRADNYDGPRVVKFPVNSEPARAVAHAQQPTPHRTAETTTNQQQPQTNGAASHAGDSILDQKLDLAQKRMELQIEALRTTMQPQVQHAAPTPSFGDTLTALTPIMMRFLETQQSNAQRSQEMFMQMMQRSDQNMAAILERASARPAETPKDPLVQTLLEKALNSDDKSASMLLNMGQYMQTLTGSFMQLVHAQAELAQQNAPQASPWTDLVQKAMDVYIANLSSGTQAVQHTIAQAAEPQALGDGTTGATEGDDEEVSVDVSPLMRLEIGLRSKATAEELVDLLAACQKDREFAALVAQHKGLIGLLQARLGHWMALAPDRLPYIQQTLVKVMELAQKRGLLTPPPAPPTREQTPPQTAKSVPKGSQKAAPTQNGEPPPAVQQIPPTQEATVHS